MNVNALCGWTPNNSETEKVLSSLAQPLFGDVAEIAVPQTNVFLYDLVRKVKGGDLDPGPQGIGDCTSWGYAGGGDVLQCTQIAKKLLASGLLNASDPEDIDSAISRRDIVETFEEMSTEAIYALGRCEVGKQWNSYSDGGVGAWMAKAVAQYGYLSRPALVRAGLKGNYDSKRAKLWGAKGLPDELEPIAKQHIVKNASLVKSFDEAAAAIINYLNPVIVCSNRGFSMKRDTQGFCSPSGVWYHCMKLIAIRWDRPGGLIVQSWGAASPTGPLMFNQPTNSFWVDANVLDYMLRQNDSFVISDLTLYTKEIDNPFSWEH